MINRIFACILSLTFIASLSGCTKSASTETAEEKAPVITGTDYTVIPENSYEIPENAKENAHSVQGMRDYAFSATLENFAEYATVVVEGEISNVYYVEIDGGAWTQMDVCITNSIAGEYEAGDVISIYTNGGYLPMNQYFSEEELNAYYSDVPQKTRESTIIKYLPEGIELPQEGEKYLFFLAPSGETRPDGTYEMILGYSNSLFEITDSGYVNDFNDESFSLDELNLAIEAAKTA